MASFAQPRVLPPYRHRLLPQIDSAEADRHLARDLDLSHDLVTIADG
jgi:hypothetical protein